MSLNKDMGDRHEAYVAQTLGAEINRGSGNQWRSQMDGRHSRMHRLFAFAWDCKATLKKSMSISRVAWAKAVEQAQGERPAMPIRFYDDDGLRTFEDLILLRFADFSEMLQKANETSPMIVLCTKPPVNSMGIEVPSLLSAIIIEDGGQKIWRSDGVYVGRSQIVRPDVFRELDLPDRMNSDHAVIFELKINDKLINGPAIVITYYGVVYELRSPGETLKVTHV